MTIQTIDQIAGLINGQTGRTALRTLGAENMTALINAGATLTSIAGALKMMDKDGTKPNVGVLSNAIKDFKWELPLTRRSKGENGNAAKTDAAHFNGYSNNLSDSFRRAYVAYAKTDAQAPALADIFSQVSNEAKTFIASISESELFNAFLSAALCNNPSADFELLGIETSSMKQSKAEALAKAASDNAALVTKLELAGYIVFKTYDAPEFTSANLAIAHKASFDEKLVAFKAMLADKVKLDKALVDCSAKLDKATEPASKETLSAKVNELTDAAEKMVAGIAGAGQALVALASLIKGNADKAAKRNEAIIALVEGLVENSATATAKAIEAAQAAHDAVNSIVPQVQAQAPASIDPRAARLVAKGKAKDIQDALAILKAQEED